jgi:glycosyltransferase involved in cell wall biosynthesis
MRIFIFNRVFFPDSSATSQLATDLALYLANRFPVHAISSTAANGLSTQISANGITIHQVSRSAGKNHGLATRALGYANYYAGARRAASKLLEPGDVALVMTDPPLLSAALAGPVRSKGAHLVIWLQDVFPEVAERYGIPGLTAGITKVLRTARNKSLARASRVIAIADEMANYIKSEAKLPDERLTVIHNWADGQAITPIAPGDNDLRRQWALEKKFVVGYSGNLGRVHEFNTLLGAVRALRNQQSIAFIVIGGGPQLAHVRNQAEAEGLNNIRFLPHQPRDRLAQSLSVPDVHICSLRPEFEGLVYPSKLYGIMAAGRPTIFIGAANSSLGSLLEHTRAGISVPIGDCKGLVNAIEELSNDGERRLALGGNARKVFLTQFEQRHALGAWEKALLEAVPPKPGD